MTHVRSVVEHRARWFERTVVTTRWVQPGDDLPRLLRQVALPLCRTDSVVAISEKLVVVALGRTIPAEDVEAGRLARFLARRVRPIGDSRGLSIPEKMQYVLDQQGAVRIVAATAAGALTRPLGLRGAFYVVAGDLARSVDGMRPPYEHVLVPPLDRPEARRICRDLAADLGSPVAIVDINDRGGAVRATSPGLIDAATLLGALRDNPLGQRDQATPIVIVREVDPPVGSVDVSDGDAVGSHP
jgi:F420-0:gamma-glutamyl ligase